MREMKRLIAIASCLFVIITGAASAWASCNFESLFGPNSAITAHSHDHHPDSHHDHDNRTVIHCPTLDAFPLTATFSASRNDRLERVTLAAVPELDAQFGLQQFYHSMHGPPGYSRFSNTPSYILLSVLRI